MKRFRNVLVPLSLLVNFGLGISSSPGQLTNHDDHGGNPASATTVGLNSITNGIIGYADINLDDDYFRVVVTEPGIIVFRSLGDTDTMARLFNEAGQFLDSNDDNGEDRNFHLPFEVTAGVYYLEVSGFSKVSPKTGPYELAVNFIPGNPLTAFPAEIGASENGQRVSFEVFSPTPWTWSCEADWVRSNSPVSNIGNQTIGLTIRANTTVAPRTTQITINNGEETVTIPVQQGGLSSSQIGNFLVQTLPDGSQSVWRSHPDHAASIFATLTTDEDLHDSGFSGGGETKIVIPPSSKLAEADNIWGNHPIQAHDELFVVEFVTTPRSGSVDTVMGFSSGPADFWTDLAAYVRFAPNGKVDARNGGAFAAVSDFGYSADVAYRVRMKIDVPSRTYSAWVGPVGAAGTQIALHYAFRTEQATVVSLNNFACLTWSGGTQEVRDFVVSAVAEATISDSWFNKDIGERTGLVRVRMRTIPGAANVDTVIGLSQERAFSWADLVVGLRFAPDGKVDARNGGAYQAVSFLAYEAGKSYDVELVVDFDNGRYDAMVTPQGGVPITIADDYHFRNEQQYASRVNHFAALSWGGGTQFIEGVFLLEAEIGVPPMQLDGSGESLSVAVHSYEMNVTKELRLVGGRHAADEITTITNHSMDTRFVSLLVTDDGYGGFDYHNSVLATSLGEFYLDPDDQWFILQRYSDIGEFDSTKKRSAVGMVSWRWPENQAKPLLEVGNKYGDPYGDGDYYSIQQGVLLLPGQSATLTVRREIFPTVAEALASGVPLELDDREIEVSIGGGADLDMGAVVNLGPIVRGHVFEIPIRIRNVGPEVISSLDVSVGPEEFYGPFMSVSVPPPSSLLPGEEAVATMLFNAPLSLGYGFFVEVHILSDDRDRSAFRVRLEGDFVTAQGLYSEIAETDHGLTGDNALPAAVPFGDGTPNLLKYAFGMDLGRADAHRMIAGIGESGLPSVTLEGGGESRVLRVEHVRRLNSGLRYRPKVSGSLAPGSFVEFPGSPARIPIRTGWERAIWEIPVPMSLFPSAFATVEVTLD